MRASKANTLRFVTTAFSFCALWLSVDWLLLDGPRWRSLPGMIGGAIAVAWFLPRRPGAQPPG